jgi:hypothetical protein
LGPAFITFIRRCAQAHLQSLLGGVDLEAPVLSMASVFTQRVSVALQVAQAQTFLRVCADRQLAQQAGVCSDFPGTVGLSPDFGGPPTLEDALCVEHPL